MTTKNIKKYILFLIYLFAPLFSFSQEIQILSKQTEKPIQFAAIRYIDKNKQKEKMRGFGTYTNKNGIAQIFLDSEVDSIEITHQKQQFKIPLKNIPKKIYLEINEVLSINNQSKKDSSHLFKNDIYLGKDSTIYLEEVIVREKKASTKYLGHYSKSKRRIDANILSGREITMFIQNPYQKEKSIKSVVFVSHRLLLENPDILFRINFYKNKNNKPLESYINENIIFVLKNQKNKKEKIEINVQNLQINLPKEGLFVGIEYMGLLENETNNIIPKNISDKIDKYSMGITIIKTKKITYQYSRYKFSNFEKGIYSREWHDYSDHTWRFFEKTGKDTYYSPAIGIEVYE